MINYLYFGAFFLVLLLTSAGNIFAREDLTGSRFYFLLYAIGQSLLEVSLLIFLADCLFNYIGKKSFYAFIGFTFGMFLLHSLDFMMSRVLDLSIFGALKVFVLDETFENFLFLLNASGIPNWVWGIFFLLVALIPFIGMLIYKITDKLSAIRPIAIKRKYFLQAFICIPAGLIFWDFSAGNILHPDAYTAFIKAIPWKCTFSYPEKSILQTKGPVKTPKSQDAIMAMIQEESVILDQKPNIYLFVIESLREDSITEAIAPNLYQFKKDYTSFDLALSNGNGSHISWFSIFHSQFSYFWSHLQKNWKIGSPALNLLKKWGYQIRLYSSAELGYYAMEKHIFGHQLQLLDHKQSFEHIPPISAADADRAAMAQVHKDLQEDPSLRQGQVFIIFLDSTHFDYSWPKDWNPKFSSFAAPYSYFQLFHSNRTISLMKNRYHNAVNYIDHLFGSFFNSLPNKEEAIVIVTGDHGEEFFEKGNLFHNSHLANEQMHIPIYFKFGDQKKEVAAKKVISQMDIFPSIIDYFGGSFSFLEGESIFQPSKWPYAVISRFNASNTPSEFCIHNGANKLILQFTNSLSSQQLRVVSLKNAHDKCLFNCNQVHPWIKEEFGPALDRLFGKID
jgi:glucan phosphoethanolaminetransferase (alkaline phosphatase superfamily)